MGQCGCGDMNPIAQYELPDGNLLVVDEYHGCRDCETPIGYTLHLFTPEEGKNWIFDPPVKILPDELGKVFPLIGKEEMILAAQEIEKEDGVFRVVFDGDEYASLSDFMHDKGLDLLQRAMRHRKVRGGN